MFGRLVKHPLNYKKIYFVRDGKRSHVDDSAFLAYAWSWDEVGSISKKEFDKLTEISPIGFKQSFIKTIISLIKKY